MNNRVYVENLPGQTTERELGDVFSAFGNVAEVNIARDAEPLVGSVKMVTAEGAQAAISALNGKTLGTCTLAVREWWSGQCLDLSEWRKWATPPDELPGVLNSFGLKGDSPIDGTFE